MGGRGTAAECEMKKGVQELALYPFAFQFGLSTAM
jgi:hypothetical protein